MKTIDEFYNFNWLEPSDINEHFPTLKKYSSQCEHVTELGVKAICSTWGLLAGKPKRMVSLDIFHPSHYGGNLDEVYESCKLENINFQFIQDSSLNTKLENTDLLFIDTSHVFFQLLGELFLHGSNTNKFIIMHDTTLYKNELWPAINNFMNVYKEWVVLEEFKNNNGLTVLGKIFL